MLVCSLTASSGCTGLSDMFGPHKTYEGCMERAREMHEFAHTIFPFPINVTYGCKQLGETI